MVFFNVSEHVRTVFSSVFYNANSPCGKNYFMSATPAQLNGEGQEPRLGSGCTVYIHVQDH